MSIAAPAVVWTPLPPDLGSVTLAAVDRTVLVGGVGPVGPSVLELGIDAARAVVRGPWTLPSPLPANPRVEPVPFEEAGPARVSARRVGTGAVSTVTIAASVDFPGSLGGWYHPLGTEVFEYVGSASPESDIDADEPMGIGDGVLVTSESGASEFFVVERGDTPADVEWPGGTTTRSRWRHRQVPLPEGVVTSEVHVSSSGRWVALRGEQSSRMRDGVLIYQRGPSSWSLALRLDYPGFRVSGLAVTDDWLVIVETDRGASRLRWRTAVAGADRYLEVGDEPGSIDVLGDRALVVQRTRALVVDLARGEVTHNVQRGGASGLGLGKLVPGFAVFGLPGQVGVAPL